MVVASGLVSVEGASFDGTYDYAYNLNGPGGWETHRVDSGFIVRSGRISSNPSAFSGTVDSGGNVHFTGPSPYGSPSATFTGVIRSDGTGEGDYRDSQGLVGSWSVVRVSGGGGFSFLGIVDMLLNLMYSLSFIGEAVGLSGTTAAAVGSAAVIFVVVSVLAIVTTRGSGRGKRAVVEKRGAGEKPTVRYDFSEQRPYGAEGSDASPSVSSPGVLETPASTIGVPPPPRSPPMGLHVEGRALPEGLDLRSAWLTGQVNLSWERPPYDPEKYELMGYEVIRLEFDGSSTVAGRGAPVQFGPDSTGCTAPYNQSYRWNTGGDIEGYRVDALFRDLHPDSPSRIVRVGRTAYAPMG
ncbi:MAG: hypothetical protein NWE88_02065 [Candidatus Bathyarchaeota archaeon]|nr:hypothetical protein [Candidatus Bathyarchaeota archaeon]